MGGMTMFSMSLALSFGKFHELITLRCLDRSLVAIRRLGLEYFQPTAGEVAGTLRPSGRQY